MTDPKGYLGVMVSSTFNDLPEHRRALEDLVLKHKLLPIAMEHHGGARADLDVLDASLEKVGDCAAYIGIISHRYGQVPESHARNPEGLSLTELEFNRAVEKRRPILLFLMADNHPVMAKDVEVDPFRREKLHKFRQRAKLAKEGDGVERVYEEFSSLEDFSRKAAVALSWLGNFLEKRALMGGLEDDAGPRSRGGPRETRFQGRPIDFAAYIQDKRDAFTGRTWLFEDIEGWRAAETGARALLIKAEYGVGKTALIAEYIHRYQRETALAWHFCRQDVPETLRPGSFVRSVAAQLARALPAYRASLEQNEDLRMRLADADANPASAFEMAVLSPLARVPAPKKVRLLLIDALDEALELEPPETGLRVSLVSLLAQ